MPFALQNPPVLLPLPMGMVGAIRSGDPQKIEWAKELLERREKLAFTHRDLGIVGYLPSSNLKPKAAFQRFNEVIGSLDVLSAEQPRIVVEEEPWGQLVQKSLMDFVT